jgi:undecaprenyl diphosphate synthase
MFKLLQTPVEPKIPQHVAIIMDGNGRWARARGLPRTLGHREGVEALRRTVEAAGKMGVKYLTVFGFSTENWTRPAEEVDALFELMRLYVAKDLDRLAKEGVCIRVIGGRDGLAADVREIIVRAEERTALNSGLRLTVAFNYGGRSEIVRAVQRIAEDVQAGKLEPESITAQTFDLYLDTFDLPSPDLVIRTSGEQRISNFLLWQAAYAELVFLDVLWPDFDQAALESAFQEYQQRDRRFGGVIRDTTP